MGERIFMIGGREREGKIGENEKLVRLVDEERSSERGEVRER